jgi:hypothetical protein
MNPLPISRRDFLRRSGVGFGMLGLADLLGTDTRAATHFAPKTKCVIHFFLNGSGRDFRLTDVEGRVMKEILA